MSDIMLNQYRGGDAVEKNAVIESLHREDVADIFNRLVSAYEMMTENQRRYVFGDILSELKIESFPGEFLLREIESFRDDSLSGRFYAPFSGENQDFRGVPPETEEWFEKLRDFCEVVSSLVEQGEYAIAIDAFELIYELVDLMETEDDIVYLKEADSFALPVDEKEFIAMYLKALAAVENSAGFAHTAMGLLQRDRCQDYSLNVYEAALGAGSAEQIKAFEQRIAKYSVPTGLN